MGFDQSDEEPEGSSGKMLWLREPAFWLILIGFFLLILAALTNFWGTYEIKRTAFAGSSLILVGLLAWAGVGYIKHKTPKFICENYKTTINPMKNWKSGPYVIFRAGGLFWGPINTQGSEGTVVVPITSNYAIGSSGFAAKVSVFPVKFDELPPDIQDKVITYQLKPPFMWGIKSEEQKLLEGQEIIEGEKIKNPDLNFVWQVMRSQNVMVTELRELLSKGMVGSVEELQSQASRIIGKSQRGGFADAFKRAIKSDDKNKGG